MRLPVKILLPVKIANTRRYEGGFPDFIPIRTEERRKKYQTLRWDVLRYAMFIIMGLKTHCITPYVSWAVSTCRFRKGGLEARWTIWEVNVRLGYGKGDVCISSREKTLCV
jgi:hypothetical protein